MDEGGTTVSWRKRATLVVITIIVILTGILGAVFHANPFSNSTTLSLPDHTHSTTVSSSSPSQSVSSDSSTVSSSSESSNIILTESMKTTIKRVIIVTVSVLFAVGWIALTGYLLYRRYSLFATAPAMDLVFDILNPRVDMATVSKEALRSDHRDTDDLDDTASSAVKLSESVNYWERQALILLLVGVVVFVGAIPCSLLASPTSSSSAFVVVKRAAVAAVLAVIAEGTMFACLLYL